MPARPPLSAAGRIAREHDPDRFLTTLFAPGSHRETLFLLIAFNHELVRALEMKSARSEAGPIASLIRLQWWREVVEGASRRHELAEPLGAALAAGRLDRETLLDCIEGREAEAAGFDDAMMLDWRGHLSEATGANVFLVLDGELHTPTPDCFLDGITRRTVMALAAKRQIPVVERAIMPDEMDGASEVFLAGSAAEVTPVCQIGTLSYGYGPVTRRLLQDYEALVRMPPEQVRLQLAA